MIKCWNPTIWAHAEFDFEIAIYLAVTWWGQNADEKMDQMPKIKVQTDCIYLDLKPHKDHLYAAYIQKLTGGSMVWICTHNFYS